MYRECITVLLALVVSLPICPQRSSYSAIRTSIANHFSAYSSTFDIKQIKVERSVISHDNREITIYLNPNFAYQRLRADGIDTIYANLRLSLPKDVRGYKLSIYSNNIPIEKLVPNHERSEIDSTLRWSSIVYSGAPWVTNISKPFSVTCGLANRHLSLTPSHGYYYDQEDSTWQWQRPPLFGTREDLISQSILYPYLIPMLEGAGAVVHTSRERDWQHRSVIVDNKDERELFQLYNRKKRWHKVEGAGYEHDSARICHYSGEATVMVAETHSGNRRDNSIAMWCPEIPQDGYYAVYVSYRSFPNSVTDARYIVFHSGGSTTFHVNQQMGGGTWLYLGHFHFKSGKDYRSMVTLDNYSSEEGVVCADAVRFGGGMGNTTRFGTTSNMARYLEGARYYAQFAGAPDSVFLKYDGGDDYREDIYTRPRMTNWLSGGSIYNPTAIDGASVPLELSLALHTDAGYFRGDTLVGTLGIYTTNHNNGMLESGLKRDVSRDFADMLLSGLQRDLSLTLRREWVERALWDKDYCESREPAVPSMILELLSHQNFYDIQYILNPNFQFIAARSIYKSVARWVNFMHNRPTVIAPLPVHGFSVTINGNDNTMQLSWAPTIDTLETTATPTAYILYTAIDNNGFDNGVRVEDTCYTFTPSFDTIYRFKVTAINDGGEGFPSETLSAAISHKSRGEVLIVNGFTRLSAPRRVENDSLLGFDIASDPGVSYIASPILCGEQLVFTRASIDLEDSLALGFSNDKYSGRLLAGNSFNYPYIHGSAILPAGYSFVSCSKEAIESGKVALSDYIIVDYILGAERREAEDSIFHTNYSTLSHKVQRMVASYLDNGGCLLISGSYIGSDICATVSGEEFLQNRLHINYQGAVEDMEEQAIQMGGVGVFHINREASETQYALHRPEILEPTKHSYAIMAYQRSRYSAAVAYKGDRYRTVTLGFPFESITDFRERERMMHSILRFLTQ